MHVAFIQGIGPLELAIVLVILLLVLGPKRLPVLGRSLGSAAREFRDSITSRHDKGDDDANDDANDERRGAPAALEPPPGEKPAQARAAAIDERPLEGEVVPERR